MDQVIKSDRLSAIYFYAPLFGAERNGQPFIFFSESKRTTTSVHYSWMWNMKDVPCGLFVGVVNFTLGGIPKIVKTGGLVGDRVKIFFKRDGQELTKTHENVSWT